MCLCVLQSDAYSVCLICHNDLSQGNGGTRELECTHTFHKEVKQPLQRSKNTSFTQTDTVFIHFDESDRHENLGRYLFEILLRVLCYIDATSDLWQLYLCSTSQT